jgi:hypothetical protein
MGAAAEDLFVAKGKIRLAITGTIWKYSPIVMYRRSGAGPGAGFGCEPEIPIAKFLISSTEVFT